MAMQTRQKHGIIAWRGGWRGVKSEIERARQTEWNTTTLRHRAVLSFLDDAFDVRHVRYDYIGNTLHLHACAYTELTLL